MKQILRGNFQFSLIGLVCTLLLLAEASANSALAGLFSSDTHLNYRMTVFVETPEGIKTGSSVWGMSCHSEIHLLPQQTGGHCGIGNAEAVVVDMGQRGKLFALIRNITFGEAFEFSVIPHFPLGSKTPPGTKVTLPLKHYPLLVAFKDLNDPTSVENVLEVMGTYSIPMDLVVTKDHFEEIFGQGVKLKEITLEAVQENITTNIDTVLPWLPKYAGLRLCGKEVCFGRKLFDFLGANNFKRGL